MQIVPLQTIPNQTLQVQLEGQACTLDVFQYPFGLFMSVRVGTTKIADSVLCQNFNRIVRAVYTGFDGDFFFIDTQGAENPNYTGLGGAAARFQLCYLPPSELADVGT